MPILRIDWPQGKAQAEAWFRADWNPAGLHVSVALPHARATDRMETGRTPPAPFVLDFAFESGKGPFEIRCVPLVDPVSRMTMRHPSYLFNARLGANARLGEAGHALCQEVTLLGLMADSLETRWRSAPNEGGGLQFEAGIPWQTLQLSAPPISAGAVLPFRIRVTQPDRGVAVWGEEAGMGRLRLLESSSSSTSDPVAGVQPLVPASAIRQPAPLPVAFPNPRRAAPDSFAFTLTDAAGRVRARAAGSPAGDAVMARLGTENLPDGPYALRASSGAAPVGERTVHLVGRAVEREVDQPRARLEQRLDQLQARREPAWMEGYRARTRALLKLAALPEQTTVADLDRSRKLVADAAATVEALEARRRPDPAHEGFNHLAGLTADGRRGPVDFVPTDATQARLTVHAGRETEWNLTPLLYGTFSEPVVYDRPIYSMLDAQQLRNPSFEFGHPSLEETVQAFIRYQELEPVAANAALEGHWLARIPATLEEVAAPWMAVGRGSAHFQMECDAYNDRTCQRISADKGARGVGVAQIINLPVWRTTRYHLRGFLRSDGTVRTARVEIYHDGRPVFTVPLEGIGNSWQEFEAEVQAPRLESPENTFLLALVFDGPGRLDLDLVTLYPCDAVDGFDPQAVEQLRELRTGWVRWPGGNLASGYHWREGVGPRDQRPSLPNPSWPGLSSNFVGTDEYLHLARIAGFEPLITVNAGNGTPEEAAQWVEYVNGDTTTRLGRLRAQNGHPEPYDVRYWNIGNELWGWWQIGYTDPETHAERYAAFARAMRAVDPSIRVIANGHGGHSESPPEPWNRPLLEKFGEELDIIDLHTYVTVPPQQGLSPAEQAFLLSAIPLSYEQWLIEFRQDLVRRGLEKVEVIVGEYNGSIRSDSQEMNRLAALLIYAGYLHAFMRQGEYVVGANATEFSPFNPRALPFGRMSPRYNLFRIYSRHAGTRPVAATLETPVRQQDQRVGRDVIPIFNLPLVDAVALKDPTDGSLGISLVNRDMKRAIPVAVRLEGYRPQTQGRWFLFGAPSAESVRREGLAAGETFTITIPPHSVSLLKLYPRRTATH
jgi:alpha-N-arabinofuranosidase